MKTQILFLLALLPLTSFARPIPQPFDICSGFSCPAAMSEISQEFLAAGPLNTSAFPGVYSGECYHRAHYYNPETKHFAAVGIDTQADQFFSGGSFGFFYKENPYSEWDINMVRKETPDLYAENHRVVMESTFGFADMNPNGKVDAQVLYWYRQTPEHFYVLGVWGSSQAFVCRLQKNEK